jgi:hypothetical protein
MAIDAGDLPFPHRHVGRTIKLGFTLQVALKANVCLGPLSEKDGLILDASELILRARLLHYRMAIDASDAAASVRARLPISLDSALVAGKANRILDLGRLSRILSEADQTPRSSTTARRDVVASRPVTALAGSSFGLIARVEEKNLTHHRLGKFLKLRCVTGLANFVADISCLTCRCRLRRCRLRGPDHLHAAQQDSAERPHKQKAPHISSQIAKQVTEFHTNMNLQSKTG